MTNKLDFNDWIFQDPFDDPIVPKSRNKNRTTINQVADGTQKANIRQNKAQKETVPNDVLFTVMGRIERFLWPREGISDDGYAIAAIAIGDDWGFEKPTVKIEDVNFKNANPGATYYAPKTNDYGNITAKGAIGYCRIGQDVKFTGKMVADSRGAAFQVERYDVVEPTSVEEIKYALETGLIKGIGPDLAQKIVDKFGSETMLVMDNNIEKLLGVSGIAEKKLEMIRGSWERQRVTIKLVRELGEAGVSATIALKAYKEWRGAALDIVKDNPYKLTRLHGVGFTTADKVALGMGIAPDSIKRVEAGVLHVFEQESQNGHVFLPYDYVITQVDSLFQKLLEYHPDARINDSQIVEAIEQLEIEDSLIIETMDVDGTQIKAIYTQRSYRTETELAGRIKAINAYAVSAAVLAFRGIDWKERFETIENKLGFQLAETQQEAVRTALTSKITILTGGGGTGKTTITKAIVDELGSLPIHIALCSPTGKAATRLEEATGHDASTVHRLLGASGVGGFNYNKDMQLEADFVIVDEASMLDGFLAKSLFDAIPDKAQVLLVGDVNQLPSVGAGYVLGDMIQSGVIPVVRLSTIFRQGEGSLIVSNAAKINAGDTRLEDHNGIKGTGDYYHVESNGNAQKTIIDMVTKHIPERMGFKADDIQVLAPMKRGDIGVIELNKRLQAILNPPNTSKKEHQTKTGIFRVGDKVIQIRNNYDSKVFNGESGKIVSFDPEYKDNGGFVIEFGSGKQKNTVTYEPFELSGEIMLAYCLTIHKVQGSEYPCIVMVMSTKHYVMLARNLAYTGLTRAKRTAVIVGEKKAVDIAIRNNKINRRYTGLKERLQRS